MNVIAKTLTCLVAGLVLIPVASAAARPPEKGPNRAPPAGAAAEGERRGQRPAIELREALQGVDLSPEQRASLRQIFATVPDRHRELDEQTKDMDPRERAGRFRELQQEVRQQVFQQLSEAQRDQVERALVAAREQRQAQRAQDARGQRGPGGPGSPGGGPAGDVVERLQAAVKAAELTDAQRAEVDRVVAELREKLVEIRRDAAAAGDRPAAMEQVREAVRSARQQIVEQLTDEQRQKVREAMRAGDGPGDGQRDGARDGPGRERLRDPDRMDGGAAPPPPATQPTTKPTASAVGRFVLAEGFGAPELSATDLSGKPVTLASLKRKPTVLVFGSYSLPSFREKIPQINGLREDLGTDGQVYVLYTREAHAAGEWEVERNRDEKLAIPQPATADERLAGAKKAARALKLDVPVLVDDMSDATLLAYGNHPGACAVLDGDRRVLAYQKHFDAYGVRRALGK